MLTLSVCSQTCVGRPETRQHTVINMRLHCDLCDRPRRSCGVVGDLTVLLRRRKRRSHCALVRPMRDGVCFEHFQSARRRWAFYAVSAACSLAIPLRCRGHACDFTARRSTFWAFLSAVGMWPWWASLLTYFR